MSHYEPHNPLDDAPAIRVWLQNTITLVGPRLVASYEQHMNALSHYLMDPPSPPVMRTAMVRLREQSLSCALLYNVVNVGADDVCGQAERGRGDRQLNPEEASAYKQAKATRKAFSLRFKPLKDAMATLNSEVDALASYTEFLHLDANHNLRGLRPETMRGLTSNIKLLNAHRLDEFFIEREHLPQDESRSAAAMEAAATVKEAMTTLAKELAQDDRSNPGVVFATKTLLPQMQENLQHLEASIDQLGGEIASMAATPRRSNGNGFSHVHSTQATAMQERARDAAGWVQASGSSNVVSIFSGKTKG